MKIAYAIPSYKRAQVKTLDFIPEAKLYIDESDYDDYKRQNPDSNIIVCKKGIQGNVARVRNYILDTEFEKGVDAVCIMDDDIFGIYEYFVNKETKYGYDKRKIEHDDFRSFCLKYSILCDDFGFKLWGVNLNKDPLSYKHSTPFSLISVILGPFCVHLNNPLRYDERIPLKEDYDIAIQHLNKYRGKLRINYVHYDCLQSEIVGGCSAVRNVKREKEQFELLEHKWGSNIVRRDVTNKGRTKKQKPFDYNPIIKVPIKGL